MARVANLTIVSELGFTRGGSYKDSKHGVEYSCEWHPDFATQAGGGYKLKTSTVTKLQEKLQLQTFSWTTQERVVLERVAGVRVLVRSEYKFGAQTLYFRVSGLEQFEISSLNTQSFN